MLVVDIFFKLSIKDYMFVTSTAENFEDAALQNLIEFGLTHELEEA